MFKSWFTYLLVSQLTQSPLLGLLAVVALWYGGGSWWFGRLPDPLAPFRRWTRMRDLRETLAVNPHNMDARSELGGMIVDSRPAEAKELLDEVVRRCPELALSAYFYGLAQLRLGETEAGRASIERALSLRKDLRFGEPLVKLGDHYAGKGDHSNALEAYERATKIHASHAEAWFKAAESARALGDKERAERLYKMTLSSTHGAPAFKRRQDRIWRWRAWVRLRAR
jgi:tetratricopeptide (TPR) repeat protein